MLEINEFRLFEAKIYQVIKIFEQKKSQAFT